MKEMPFSPLSVIHVKNTFRCQQKRTNCAIFYQLCLQFHFELVSLHGPTQDLSFLQAVSWSASQITSPWKRNGWTLTWSCAVARKSIRSAPTTSLPTFKQRWSSVKQPQSPTGFYPPRYGTGIQKFPWCWRGECSEQGACASHCFSVCFCVRACVRVWFF